MKLKKHLIGVKVQENRRYTILVSVYETDRKRAKLAAVDAADRELRRVGGLERAGVDLGDHPEDVVWVCVDGPSQLLWSLDDHEPELDFATEEAKAALEPEVYRRERRALEEAGQTSLLETP